MKAVLEMPRRHSKRDVKSFLGLMGYYRHFIRDYATITTALTLTRKSCKVAYQTLKKALTSATLLKNLDFSQLFQLQTDASDVEWELH